MKINKLQTQENEDKTEKQNAGVLLLKNCSLCPRNCHADRTAGKTGYCGMDQTLRVARAALHMWEEPCISGARGSGAVFFPDVICGAVSVRIVISLLVTADLRLQWKDFLKYFWNCRKRALQILIW